MALFAQRAKYVVKQWSFRLLADYPKIGHALVARLWSQLGVQSWFTPRKAGGGGVVTAADAGEVCRGVVDEDGDVRGKALGITALVFLDRVGSRGRERRCILGQRIRPARRAVCAASYLVEASSLAMIDFM